MAEREDQTMFSIGKSDTLWLFNVAMENGPFIDDFPIKTSIYRGFSMAMLDYQRVSLDSLKCQVVVFDGTAMVDNGVLIRHDYINHSY